MIAAWLLAGALCAVGAWEDGSKPPEPDRAAYESAKASAGRDAEAQVRLALWCEARGMAAERTTHLMRAVLIDPENARARGLLGQVKHDGKWLRAEDVAKAVEQSPERQALQREYLDRRAKAGDDADDQYKLALWCEEKGLTQPMVAHLHRTLQLDPGREGAWRRLGFTRVKGRWVNPEIEAAFKAEREAQAKADRAWKPKLETFRTALGGKNRAKRAEALKALAAIEDPRAVPMLWQVFVKGGVEERQWAAADVLSRLDAPAASTALASLALFSPHAAVRSDAAALLQRRDPREFAAMLAAAIRDEVKYKVKPIDGPGSQGELLVEGEDANVRRIYRPLQSPTIQPGDQLGTDANGNVVANRPIATYEGPLLTAASAAALWSGRPVVGYLPPTDGMAGMDGLTGLPMVNSLGGPGFLWNPPDDLGAAAATLERAGVPASLSRTAVGRIAESNALWSSAQWAAAGAIMGGRPTPFVRPIIQESMQIPIQQMRAEAQASALVARQQLASDVAGIEAYNAPIREVNERAVAILKAVSGEDRGDDRRKWMNWVLDLQGYGQPFKGRTAPTDLVVEDVPIGFQPQAAPIPTSDVVGFRFFTSCFAAGTRVRTLQGERPIEEVQPGDQVLSQDTTSGRLAFKPVLEAVHNPPDWTYAIDLGKETVHPTGIHRFWKAGKGWVMARDVQPGDRLRTAGGVVEVVSAGREKLQPVFNLLLAGGDNYCVGTVGVIAHDHGLVEPVSKPFDGVPTTAELATASRP
ncbi:polymorphic toxin-type HINT domain-containing protein [Paludisphaera mucosa]|uniref:Polymorphic toxin-type HINT domain-containing protein n=1 Tax=Paludisphaera mucosa TaxID=3030827 RepID=A0ABT6FJS3_9BACT|nr:polymorphic toxin-type HINT domain-containing protein [Paludisphaera mucosa]MDG3007805.1 polymorphic toxin-type HINT domain-containing protein [Paludisphaera mucosa]